MKLLLWSSKDRPAIVELTTYTATALPPAMLETSHIRQSESRRWLLQIRKSRESGVFQTIDILRIHLVTRVCYEVRIASLE
jgi:hypothetical protein